MLQIQSSAELANACTKCKAAQSFHFQEACAISFTVMHSSVTHKFLSSMSGARTERRWR